MTSSVISERLWGEERKKETKLFLAEVVSTREAVFWSYSGVITVVPVIK